MREGESLKHCHHAWSFWYPWPFDDLVWPFDDLVWPCRLPDGFTQLRNLTTLSLNDVSLARLPPDIGRCVLFHVYHEPNHSISSILSHFLPINLIQCVSRMFSSDIGRCVLTHVYHGPNHSISSILSHVVRINLIQCVSFACFPSNIGRCVLTHFIYHVPNHLISSLPSQSFDITFARYVSRVLLL